MSWQKRETIWPILCILASLFVLIVTAPRSWERKVHRSVASRSSGGLPPYLSRETSGQKHSDPMRRQVEGPLPSAPGTYPQVSEVAQRLPDPSVQRPHASAPSPKEALELKTPTEAVVAAPSERVAQPARLGDFPGLHPPVAGDDLPGAKMSVVSSLPSEQLDPIQEIPSEKSPLVGLSVQTGDVRRDRTNPNVSVAVKERSAEGNFPSEPTTEKLDTSSVVQKGEPRKTSPSITAPETPTPKEISSGISDAQASGPEKSASSSEGLTAQRSETKKTETPEISATGRASSEAEMEQAEDAGPAWEPRALMAQLETLADDPQAGPWARQVLSELQGLVPLLDRRSPETGMLLRRLAQLGRESDALEALLTDRKSFRCFRQVRFGLYRRLDLWTHWLQEPQPMEDLGGIRELSEVDWRQLSEAVRELERLTSASPEGRAWRRYLFLDSLRELIAQPERVSPAERQAVARRILERFTRRGLAPEQQAFLNTGVAGLVQRHLRALAVEPAPETLEVFGHVEAYEATGQPSDAQRLAADCQRLLFSTHPARRALGEKLHYHYQNANLRIVITENLLNRLIPPRDPEYQWVADTVLGAPVRGRSLVFTDVAIRTIPDPGRVRLALEVTGRVSSMTTAFQGPAIFYNRSDAVYVARKPVEVGVFGIRLWPAEVEVHNSTRLRGLETDFDPIPLLGSIVQEVARSQHEARRWEANREVEAKLKARAKTQIDAEADARLTSVSRRFQDRILSPMAALGLGPEMVEAKTDSQRIMMRLRIGGAEQLGANTPRPWAPSDSLASFQAHESAINNLLDRLDLAGRTFTLPELRQWVADRLHRPEFAQRETEHDDICLTFAQQNPVVIRFQNGRFSVSLSIGYLRKGQNEWSNFQVCAIYRPEIDGDKARLVRDGVVQLRGDLDMRSQIGLRGLFGKAFDKEKPLLISPENISPDPRMRELMITQFVIEDGWVGIAVGPKQRPVPPEIARLPKAASLGPIY